jgi:hypothetical protein
MAADAQKEKYKVLPAENPKDFFIITYAIGIRRAIIRNRTPVFGGLIMGRLIIIEFFL